VSSDSLSKSTPCPLTTSLSAWRNRLSLAIGAILPLLLTVGCSGLEGPVRIKVAGHVTLDGVPLAFGVIRFIPQDDKAGPAASTQIIGGEFQFSREDGPVVASHRVEIEATDFQNFDIDDEAAFADQVQKTGMTPLGRNPVPASYNHASTLTAIVTDANDQSFQFDLTSQISSQIQKVVR